MNLVAIKQLIARYEQTYHRAANSVQLLAASKGQSIDDIATLHQAGQRSFGENYLSEALIKIAALPPTIDWHFIGPLQSNKTRKIAEHFSWVHSLDSIRLAKRLNDQRPPALPPLNICIEVNIDDEATKSGVAITDVLPLIHACQALPNLKLRGLMTLPAPRPTFDEQRIPFHALQTLYQSLRQQGIPLDTLSMGTSSDFEAAIAEGATQVRIGNALFRMPIVP